MMNYTVKSGETILDVSINSTGSPVNIQLILDANGLDTWIPDLQAGQVLVIPNTVEMQTNNLRDLRQYPVADSGFISVELFEQLTVDLEIIFFPVLLATEDGRLVVTNDGRAINMRHGND